MKHNLKITLLLLSFFIIAQFFGLLTLNQYINVKQTVLTGSTKLNSEKYLIEPPGRDDPYSSLYLTAGIIISTLIFLVIIKFKKHRLWKLWYFFAIFIAVIVALNPYILMIFGEKTIVIYITSILALITAFIKINHYNPVFHNITEILIYAGIASLIVPFLTFGSAIALLILISLYDMFAVWQSKHMIKMATFQSESNLFAGLVVPKGKRIKNIKKIKGIKTKKIESAILGGGDITFPLLFTGTYLKYSGNFIGSYLIILTSAIALFLLFFFAKKDRFYPAMPFLTIGCLIGYAFTFLI